MLINFKDQYIYLMELCYLEDIPNNILHIFLDYNQVI
jgi:hypothetical protein